MPYFSNLFVSTTFIFVLYLSRCSMNIPSEHSSERPKSIRGIMPLRSWTSVVLESK
ncbi:hypothetical protein AHF37_05676 [Paragonimus kellicotti]|nr:hypothetical protein AHF37_05676 [Paragonimus kellicotti]